MDSFKDLSTSESNPSWTQANHDMTGLKSLQILEIDGLSYLATTVINYRGHRIIAQSIIPGILNNSELASLAEYGTVDEQKTIQSNEQFHTMMKQVAEKMNLQVNKIIDGSENEVEIAGCVEIKGIRGTDKRCYIVDLQGMTPRDANYLGEENHTCLIRQELMILYQRQKNLESAKAKMEEYEKELEKEKAEREPKIEEGKEPTEEYKKQIAEINQEFNMKKIQKFEEYLKECSNEVYNTNVFKKVKLAISEEEIKVEEDKVKNLAKFLKEEAIQSLIKNLNRNEGVPTDSASLRDFFHQNGINIRYLGYVAEQIKEKNLSQMQYMIEREVIIRSIKHILNQYIRENESDELLASLISHVFNCLLAPKDFIKKLDDGVISYKPVTLKELSEENKPAEKVQDPPLAAPESEQKLSKKEKKKQKN